MTSSADAIQEDANVPELIVEQARLQAVIPEIADQPVYAVDTEFHRERTYYPKVALVQINWGSGTALIDPLAVSLEPLAEVLDGPGLAVMHASSQDLEVLTRACHTVPTRLFDTQVAAGFTGLRSPSLAALHDKLLGVRLPKGDRLTDWLRRPLGTTQLEYAASDVRYLLEIHRLLETDLTQRGRLQWAEAECQELLRKGRTERDPETAWLKIKETRHLGKRSRGVAQAVAEWRECRARELDQPPRFVLPDLAVVGVAQRPPDTVEELHKVRGLDGRHIRSGHGEELLEVVHQGLQRDVDLPKRPNNRVLMEQLRPAVTLVSAWLNQFARDIDIDPALLGTRADIEAVLRGDSDARLGEGWRAEHVGDPIQRLIGGRAALAFDHGRLLLEERHKPD
ncbi:MAG: ribonuclease D [Acidimicrobiales bacterium]